MNKLKKYLNKLLDRPAVAKIISLSKRLVLPGFDGMPLFDVGVFFIQGIQKGAITLRASAVAFSFFLAMFPALLFFFTLIPYLPIPDFHATLMQTLNQLMPVSAFATIETTLDDILTRQRSGLLSVGFVMALYFSTNGITRLMEAFRQTYHHVDTRSYLKQQLISLALTLVLSFLLITAVLLIILGTWAINMLASKEFLSNNFGILLITAGKWVVIIALITFGISFLYYFAPSYRKRFRFFSAGSSLASLMFILASVGFNFYVNNFARYNALYGSIGTLIIFLLWIYFINIVLLIGYELNVSIRKAKHDYD